MPIPLPWYRPEDYDEVRQLFGEHGYIVPPTYAEWLAAAEQEERDLEAEGYATLRCTYVRPGRFVQWCEVHQRPADRDALLAYVMDVLEYRRQRLREHGLN